MVIYSSLLARWNPLFPVFYLIVLQFVIHRLHLVLQSMFLDDSLQTLFFLACPHPGKDSLDVVDLLLFGLLSFIYGLLFPGQLRPLPLGYTFGGFLDFHGFSRIFEAFICDYEIFSQSF